MSQKIIRYRYAVLLLLASLALVSNPLWHAISHIHFGHNGDDMEIVADTHWAEEDLCPYCDAVSQFVKAPASSSPEADWIRVGVISPVDNYDIHTYQFWPSRLRAPPVQA